MATTTVRLDENDEAILDSLASEYGGRSSAIRQAIRNLASRHQLQAALVSFVADWDEETGPADPDESKAMADRYEL